MPGPGPSPIVRSTLQAALLNVTSAILAQLLARYQGQGIIAPDSAWNPLGLELMPILEFLFLSLWLTPVNVLWQQFLEQRWPGYPGGSEEKKVKIDDGGTGVTIEHKLSIPNTAAKWAMDQTVGAWTNNFLIISFLALVRGSGVAGCRAALQKSFWPIVSDGYKLWPLVSIVSFLFVPPARRVVMGAAVGLFWNVYLVLKTAA